MIIFCAPRTLDSLRHPYGGGKSGEDPEQEPFFLNTILVCSYFSVRPPRKALFRRRLLHLKYTIRSVAGQRGLKCDCCGDNWNRIAMRRTLIEVYHEIGKASSPSHIVMTLVKARSAIGRCQLISSLRNSCHPQASLSMVTFFRRKLSAAPEAFHGRRESATSIPQRAISRLRLERAASSYFLLVEVSPCG